MQSEGGNVSENQSKEHGEESKDDLVAEKPARISKEKWLKFQQLKERRQKVCKQLPGKTDQKRGRKRVHNDDAGSSQTEKKSKSEIQKDNRKAWKELCSNIDANAHLTQQSIAKEKPKSKLEEQLDEAIKEGSFSKAEKLSDEISQQDFGVKISDAIAIRECKKQKQEEEKWKKSKKKKKLLWGFEQKERWESKGNM